MTCFALQAWSTSMVVPGSQTSQKYDIIADYVGGIADIRELMGNNEVGIPSSKHVVVFWHNSGTVVPVSNTQ